MNQAKLLAKAESYVKTEMAKFDPGHDFSHIIRVRRLAKKIALAEQADQFVVEITALLHDVGDSKFSGDETAGRRLVTSFLDQTGLAADLAADVSHTIDHMSYRKNFSKAEPLSLEGQIVQDADRLDAIGAIGIARAFSYGGKKGRVLYDPKLQPEQFHSITAYQQSNGSTINHFYEKLLLLKDKLNTATARHIALGRHQFMEQYLAEFLAEWAGER